MDYRHHHPLHAHRVYSLQAVERPPQPPCDDDGKPGDDDGNPYIILWSLQMLLSLATFAVPARCKKTTTALTRKNEPSEKRQRYVVSRSRSVLRTTSEAQEASKLPTAPILSASSIMCKPIRGK